MKPATARKVPSSKGKVTETPIAKIGINESNPVTGKTASPAKSTRSQTSTQDSPHEATLTRARKEDKDGSILPDPAQKGTKKGKAVNAMDLDALTASKKGDDADSTKPRDLETNTAGRVLCTLAEEAITEVS